MKKKYFKNLLKSRMFFTSLPSGVYVLFSFLFIISQIFVMQPKGIQKDKENTISKLRNTEDGLLNAYCYSTAWVVSEIKEDMRIGSFLNTLQYVNFFHPTIQSIAFQVIRVPYCWGYGLKKVFNILELYNHAFAYIYGSDMKEDITLDSYSDSQTNEGSYHTLVVLVSIILLSIILSYYFIHVPLLKKIALHEEEVLQTKLKIKHLKNHINSKNNQINSYFFNFEQKNTCISQLLEKVSDLEKVVPTDKKSIVQGLKASIKNNLTVEKKWNDFHKYYEDSQYGFHAILTSKYPELKANDLKICSLLRLNLPIKESADVLGISSESLKTSRYRLRKKMGISPKENIVSFLINLESQYESTQTTAELAS